MPAPEASATVNTGSAGEGSFEYTDNDGERVRLVKNLESSPPSIEVLVEGVSFWKGVPEFSQITGLLTCGTKGASSVPEASRPGLQQYLASMPTPVLALNLS